MKGTVTSFLVILSFSVTSGMTKTNLEIAAEAISFQISLLVLVEFDLVVFSHGVSHHNATLRHQLSKLLCADVRRQACGKKRYKPIKGKENKQLTGEKVS